MTDSEHRMVAAILGYPSCCVEAWLVSIHSGEPAATARGGVHERLRTPREVEALHRAVSVVLGRPWGVFRTGRYEPTAGDMEKCYVPCDQCALVAEHWYPYDRARWTIAELDEAAQAAQRSVTKITL